jgi:hypothetical protein
MHHVCAPLLSESELPVYVKDDFIGVEVPFVVEIKRFKPVGYKRIGYDQTQIDVDESEETYYYCGRIDGVHNYGSLHHSRREQDRLPS